MADLSPPPTYAEVILVEENPQPGRPPKAKFNPIWLKWFLDLAATINAAGGTTILHNDTGSIQGGSASERYHLTSAELAALGAATTNVLLQRVFRQSPPAQRPNWGDMENILIGQVFGG